MPFARTKTEQEKAAGATPGGSVHGDGSCIIRSGVKRVGETLK